MSSALRKRTVVPFARAQANKQIDQTNSNSVASLVLLAGDLNNSAFAISNQDTRRVDQASLGSFVVASR